MSCSTCIPLLFSSARTPAFNLSPGAQHQHTHFGGAAALRGDWGPPLRPATQQGPSGMLWRERPAQKGSCCFASISQLTQRLPEPGSPAEPSQHLCLGWPSSSLPRADQVASPAVGNSHWVTPDIRPHELPGHCCCNGPELAQPGHPLLLGVLLSACYSQTSSILTLYNHTHK